jgi:hypothetical protein
VVESCRPLNRGRDIVVCPKKEDLNQRIKRVATGAITAEKPR